MKSLESLEFYIVTNQSMNIHIGYYHFAIKANFIKHV